MNQLFYNLFVVHPGLRRGYALVQHKTILFVRIKFHEFLNHLFTVVFIATIFRSWLKII